MKDIEMKRINLMQGKSGNLSRSGAILALLATTALITLHNAPTAIIPTKIEKVHGRSITAPELESLESQVLAKARKIKTLSGIRTERSSTELRITLGTDEIFELGTALLNRQGASALYTLARIIRQDTDLLRSNVAIKVEGHTDTQPIVKHRVRYSTNFELGQARASLLANLLKDTGTQNTSIKAMSFGSARPEDLLDEARNRRLVITITGQEDHS